MPSAALQLDVPGPHGTRSMRVSSPDRVVWPAAGITKLELAEYLVAVGEPFLRANGDRPISLQRFGGSVTGEWFFSKRPPRGVPDFVREVEVEYPSGRRHAQLVLDEPAAIVWTAQMNTVVWHPWPSTAKHPDLPDQLRLDLDPQPGRDVEDAKRVAHALRSVLEEAGLAAFVKTSGNRGLHVFAPIEPSHDFIAGRHAVIAAARELERRLPADVTTAWWKEERGERVFVDFNQAARDRTMAGAYSPRATPRATVSMPVAWEQLDAVDPDELTIRTVPALVERDGDAWASFGDCAGSIATLLEWWAADLERGLGELPYPPEHPKMPGEPPRVQPSRRKAD